jgi:glycosyltransferase involved in cell wall biosynthesis
MTILGIFLNNQFRTGGNRRYLELMEDLACRGNAVFVLMNSHLDYTPRYFNKIVLSVKYTRKGFPPASYLFKKHIKKNLKAILTSVSQAGSLPVDFIHIHGDTHLGAALFLQKKLQAPLFYAFRANDIDRAHIMRASGALGPREYIFSCLYEPLNRLREKKVSRYAQLITFQNVRDRDRFLERTGCAVAKTVIIPGNIGPPRCRPEWENKNNSGGVEKIVYIGSLSAAKGLWELLRAISRVKKKGYGFLRTHVLGRPENMAPTEELIRNLDIEENIIIEGFKDPFPWLAECDLMVYPTLYDAFPDTVLEALHTGCPVIASAAGGIPDMLSYPQLLFEPGNVEEIVDRIERCITDSAYYGCVRRLCAERAAAFRFDWAGRFEAAMKDYIKRKTGAAAHAEE